MNRKAARRYYAIWSLAYCVALISIVSNVPASETGCLDERWRETRPTNEEKKFDLANDYDQDGQRFSCLSYTTPTRLMKFIENVGSALTDGDVGKLSSMMHYPLVVNVPGYRVNKDGTRTGNSFIVASKESFLKEFNEKIYSKQLVEVFGCAKLNKMMTHPYQGIALAFGEIWIYVEPESKQLSITHLSRNTDILEKWLKKKCGRKGDTH